jgi:uncharacterized membrane protein YesL
VINFLTKFGQLVMLTVVWMICCIPVFTAGAATSAFYYAVTKSVRRDVGYPVREFFRSFRRTFRDGSIFTVLYLVWAALAYMNVRYLVHASGKTNLILLMAYGVLVFFSAALACYLFPALSRFDVSRTKLLKMAFYMTFSRLPQSVLLVIVSAALLWVSTHYLPIACMAFIPGVWCYGATYMIEPALKRFYPEPEEGNTEWYDE